MDLQGGLPKDDSSIDFTDASLKHTVDVSPLKPGGASFKTNVLIKESVSKLVYKPYIGVALFSFVFLATGLGLLFFGIFPFIGDSTEIKWVLIAIGLIFTVAGSMMFYHFYKPRVFDKQINLYYRAYNFKANQIPLKPTANYIPLNCIVAIQIIGEHIKSENGNYKSFELNLVLEDGSRRNVIDHGNLKSIIDDAHEISQFLNIPIWHAKSSQNS